MTYRIVRFYRDTEPSRRVIERGLTREAAQAHCNDPETSSSTATSANAVYRTQRLGAWFDGWEEEVSRSPQHAARDAALMRLKDMHPKDFARLQDEERAERGLRPLGPARREQLVRAEAEVERLRALLDRTTDARD